MVYIQLLESPLDFRCEGRRLPAKANPEDVRQLLGRGKEMLLRTADGTQPSLYLSYRGQYGCVVLNFFFKEGVLQTVDATGKLLGNVKSR